jgi:hypothetical protein
MGRETGSLHLLAPLLLTGGKGADLVIRGNVFLNRHIQQLSVAEMRMLRCICERTRLERVRNDDMHDWLGIAPIKEKLIQHRLK